MAYVQKNNPFKSRKDLRAAKKEEKSIKQDNFSDSELMGSTSGPSVKEARKERRQLKKSIRKGTYEPTTTEAKIGSYNVAMTSTAGEDLAESKRNIRLAKVGKRTRKEIIKEQKNKPKFDISKIGK